MGIQNARFVYTNLVEKIGSVVTASSSQSLATVPANLQSSQKSKIWRSSPTTASSTQIKAILVADLGSLQKVGAIVLAFTNLQSSSASITVKGYTSAPALGGSVDVPTVSGTALFTQTVLCCPWMRSELAGGASTYSYGLGTHARAYLSAVNQNISCRYISVEITDTYTTSAAGRFIEVANLVIGSYWSPKYNISYGANSSQEDLSEHERTQAGDLTTKVATQFKKLSFSLDYLNPVDSQGLQNIKTLGKRQAIWVSLFPDNSDNWEREQSYHGLMKFTDLPGLENFALDYYKSSWNLEEV